MTDLTLNESVNNSENPLIIREIEIDDLAPVYHLGESLFTSNLYPYLYRNWDQWEVVGLFNADHEYCLVAEINDQLAGFILGTVTKKASWTYGYIIWMGVSHQFQRRGIASKLVDKLVERMIQDGVRFVFLDTDPANTKAVKFFMSKGFGSLRKHIYLSLNLEKNEYYGKHLAEKRQKSKNDKNKSKSPAKSKSKPKSKTKRKKHKRG